MNKEYKIIDRLIKVGGFTLKEAAAICGNIITESKCDEKNEIIIDQRIIGGGLLSWVGNDFIRLNKYAKRRNKKWNEFELQIDFIIDDLSSFICTNDNENKGKSIIEVFRTNKYITSSQLTKIICNEYQKVSDEKEDIKIRWMNTINSYKNYKKYHKN